MAIARLFGVLFLVLTVIYVALSFHFHAVRRDKLGDEFDEKHGGDKTTRDAFIERNMIGYVNALRKRLILGVYVIPFTIVGVLIYVTNFA